jgi:hypothetical protein
MEASVWLPALLGIVGVLAGSLSSGWVQSRSVQRQADVAERVRRDELRRSAYADYIEVSSRTRMALARLSTELSVDGESDRADELARQLDALFDARLAAESRVAVEGSAQVAEAVESLRVTFTESGDGDDIDPEMVAAANARFRVESKRILRLIREDLGTT